jgi:rhodanese-related sulfurtransferase
MIFLLMKVLIRLLLMVGVSVLLVACLPAAPSAEGSGSAASMVIQSPVVDSRSLPATLGYEELARLLADESANILLLDVRTLEEFNQGYIAGAVLSPYDALETMFREQDKSRAIVLYCRSGNRSSIALRTLTRMGYTNVSDFGGINRWRGQLERP